MGGPNARGRSRGAGGHGEGEAVGQGAYCSPIAARERMGRYSRDEKVTMGEFAESWEGDKVGEGWAGLDVGAERLG